MHNPLTTQIVRKISEVPAQEWNRVFPGVLENYYYFKSIEESKFDQFIFYYILVYNKESLVGAAPCFIMNFPLDIISGSLLKKISACGRKIFPGFLTMKAVFCGSPACEGRLGIAGGDGILTAYSIVDGMKEIAKLEGARMLVFKDISSPDTDILDHLLKEGFYKLDDYPRAEMDIDFGSFDEYLGRLSRITRKGLKRKFRRAQDLGKIELVVTNEVTDFLDQIHGLYLQVFHKSDTQFEKVPKDFFANISKNLPDEARYFLWFINKKLVVFEFCLISDGTLIDEYVGLDYSVAYKYQLYFLTFRDIIEWCIKNGIKKYRAGQLDYNPKQRLRLKMVPLYVYARLTNPVFNRFSRFFCHLMAPGDH